MWASECFVYATLVPLIPSAGEMKTKPTQHSVKELRSIGIQPDIWFAGAIALSSGLKQKMSEFCDARRVRHCQDAKSICEVPLSLKGKDWRSKHWIYCNQINANRIAVANAGGTFVSPATPGRDWIVGKYIQLSDAYLGCGSAAPCGDRYGWRPYLRWINAEDRN